MTLRTLSTLLWADRHTGLVVIGGSFAAYPITLAICAMIKGFSA